MTEQPYHPEPIPTDHVVLASDLEALGERLAENAHELWAAERIAQGWKYGPRRDDTAKEHPDLIPYQRLPESEKAFDRQAAAGTLKAILTLGYRITSPLDADRKAPPAAGPAGLGAWLEALRDAGATARSGEARSGDFDMVDRPEVDALGAGACPTARAAMEEHERVLVPVWAAADSKAMRLRGWHQLFAAVAIGMGTMAIVFAVLQLMARQVWSNHPEVFEGLALAELVSVIIFLVALLVGLLGSFHHGWLANRQKAERLRLLKFSSFSWPELWCNLERWKARLSESVAAVAPLDKEGAQSWAKLEQVALRLPEPLSCAPEPADVAAIAELYHVKRLEHQRAYFERQSQRDQERSWVVDSKVSLGIAIAAAMLVMLHGFHLLRGEWLEVGAIGLAAILPVAGFGLRAWTAAFEVARSRTLFQAKARAVGEFAKHSAGAAAGLPSLLHHIAQGEHFFEAEHREWCRLQLEAEWIM